MINIFDFQLSVFNNYEELKPSTDNTQKILNAYSEKTEIIPSTFTINNFNIMTGQVDIMERIKVLFEATPFSLFVLPERIDVSTREYPKQESITADPMYASLFDTSCDYLGCFFDAFPLKGNRIGISFNYMFDEMELVQNVGIMKKFMKEIPFYKEIQTNEAALHLNGIITKNINEKIENINCNSTLSIAFHGEDKARSRICLTIDINTIAENLTVRFGSQEINDFSILAKELAASIINDVNVEMEK